GFEGKTVLRNIQTKSGERVAAGVAVVACGSGTNLGVVRDTPFSGAHGSPGSDYFENQEKGVYAVWGRSFYSEPLDGRYAAPDSLGKCARTRSDRRRQHYR